MDVKHELDRIIDIGIVNAKYDTDVLKHIRKLLKRYSWRKAVDPPKDARYVLVAGTDHHRNPVIKIGQHIGGHWYTSCTTMDDVTLGDTPVTHWMELPGYPEEEL